MHRKVFNDEKELVLSKATLNNISYQSKVVFSRTRVSFNFKVVFLSTPSDIYSNVIKSGNIRGSCHSKGPSCHIQPLQSTSMSDMLWSVL